jgi:hypothetical protein
VVSYTLHLKLYYGKMSNILRSRKVRRMDPQHHQSLDSCQFMDNPIPCTYLPTWVPHQKYLKRISDSMHFIYHYFWVSL